MTQFIDTLVGIFQSSGFAQFGEPGGWLYAVMICVGCFLLYLAIVKEFEPLILLPMAFGMILANLPGSGVIHMQYFVGDGLEHPMWVEILNNGGLADMLYMGVKLGIYPPLIFLGIGTMTDFAPLISNPKATGHDDLDEYDFGEDEGADEEPAEIEIHSEDGKEDET